MEKITKTFLINNTYNSPHICLYVCALHSILYEFSTILSKKILCFFFLQIEPRMENHIRLRTTQCWRQFFILFSTHARTHAWHVENIFFTSRISDMFAFHIYTHACTHIWVVRTFGPWCWTIQNSISFSFMLTYVECFFFQWFYFSWNVPLY
jgi:hypothetical protein